MSLARRYAMNWWLHSLVGEYLRHHLVLSTPARSGRLFAGDIDPSLQASRSAASGCWSGATIFDCLVGRCYGLFICLFMLYCFDIICL